MLTIDVASRLLDEKGIHHGKETKPDTSDVTAGLGHSKLLPGHKDKSHTDTPKDHHHDNQTTPPPSDGGSSGHKGLAEKIKGELFLFGYAVVVDANSGLTFDIEKLHIHH